MNPALSFQFFYPEIVLLAGAFLVLTLDFLARGGKWLGILALFILAIAAVISATPPGSLPLFYGCFKLDPFTHLFRYAACATSAGGILLSLGFKRLKNYRGEYYSLFLFMAFALILMAAAANLLMIYLAIEFVSLLSYLLVGFLKRDPAGKEAAIKYFLFGSFSSGLMLFGMSLLFGASGSIELFIIQQRLLEPVFFPIVLTGSLLFLAGIGFKISMAPFHFWAPDAYEGAPTPVTAFLTVGPKALGFVILTRIMVLMVPWFGDRWETGLSLLAILTMTTGNLLAIAQINIKRLLAYSSIAQAGYILIGIAAVSKLGIIAITVYLLAYIVTNLGAFTAVQIASENSGTDDLASYEGLSKRAPALAACLTFFLLSLAGIPPMAGFIGKLYVFSAALQSNLIILAVAAAINSIIAAFYYFKIVRLMYLTPSRSESSMTWPFALNIALGICLAGTIAIGLFPAPFIAFLERFVIV
ncbi:MAG: NADH-quinone oxidoreductase subunit N [Candidatus Omnitrophota bacterium]